MRADILTDDLRHAAAILAKSTPKRTTLPILRCALVETVGRDAVRLSTTDLEIGTTMILAADAAEQGRAALDIRALLAAAKSAPKGSTMILELKPDGRMVATAGPVSAVIPTLPADEYPAGFRDGVPILDIPAAVLRSMILETAACIATDETRPILTGMHITHDGQHRLAIETADNYRLARAVDHGPADGVEPFDIVPAGRGMVHWAKSAPDGDATVSRGNGWISIRSGQLTVYSRLIDGRYPNVDSVIPASWPDHATADRRELLAAAKSIAAANRGRDDSAAHVYINGSIVIGTRDGSTMVDVRSGGWADDPHPSDMDIGIDPAYLVDTLAAIGDETVRIGLSDRLHPIGIESSTGTVHVIMPVRLSA